MVLEHFTVCYKQSITLQNFVFDKFRFVELLDKFGGEAAKPSPLGKVVQKEARATFCVGRDQNTSPGLANAKPPVNQGMLATGKHGYFNSLRGAPP